ncbi:hypothetical protein [Geobacter sp. FeAm09]|uniref:hypothetical protein n=1 Tax=Geobacter sp. FeAm09 TaxID=2597769 RepID=UPI00143DE59D|nr:hypothetical protein [Geobacter sp. FeAm09]
MARARLVVAAVASAGTAEAALATLARLVVAACWALEQILPVAPMAPMVVWVAAAVVDFLVGEQPALVVQPMLAILPGAALQARLAALEALVVAAAVHL